MPNPAARSKAALVLCLLLFGCGQAEPEATSESWGGDAQRGAVIADRMACGSCHIIPGIPLANSLAGPPLTHFARRKTIAGLLSNTPDNLTRWIQHPQAVAPGSVMPDVGLGEAQARDIAAYLDTLD